MFLRESLVYLVVSSLSLAALLFLSRQVTAGSPSPLDVIPSGTEQGLQIIKSSLSGEGPALQQRRNEILKIVDEYFREQFASILSSEPFDSLLKRLREKVAAQAPL